MVFIHGVKLITTKLFAFIHIHIQVNIHNTHTYMHITYTKSIIIQTYHIHGTTYIIIAACRFEQRLFTLN